MSTSERRENGGVDRLEADLLRRWVTAATRALAVAAPRIDALNVFPVPDSDTGTNVLLTLTEADRVVRALPQGASTVLVAQAIAQGSLVGARGNSGVILSQLLHGVTRAAAYGADLASALQAGHEQAVAAIAHPVTGTVLSASGAAAEAAALVAPGSSSASVALAALEAARDATRTTPQLLPVLRAAGVVDAGASAFVVLLEALVETLTGSPVAEVVLEPVLERPEDLTAPALSGAGDTLAAPDLGGHGLEPGHEHSGDGEFEVMFLLEATPGDGAGAPGMSALDADPAPDLGPHLRSLLDAVGTSVAVVGGYGRWQAHVHTDAPADAIRAGDLGRAHRVLVRDLLIPPVPSTQAGIVAVVDSPGLAADLARAGAVVQVLGPGEADALRPEDLARAVVDTRAREVVVLAADPRVRTAARALAADPLTHGIAGPGDEARGPQIAVAEVACTAQVVAAVAAIAATYAQVPAPLRAGAGIGDEPAAHVRPAAHAAEVAEAVRAIELYAPLTGPAACAALDDLHARCAEPEVLVVLRGRGARHHLDAIDALTALAHARGLDVVTLDDEQDAAPGAGPGRDEGPVVSLALA